MTAICDDLTLSADDEVVLLVNGLGATPLEELYLVFRRAHQLLSERGVRVHDSWVGEYATSLEMAGASVTVMKLNEELRELFDAPASSPFFHR
jgi:dihydroxyacetone kinase